MQKSKKWILSLLSLFILAFNTINISFALPMTIEQQTTGGFADVNKEFVYYIETNYAYIDLNQGNVERVTTLMKKCNCGFTIFYCQQNATEIWEDHLFECGKRFIYDTVTLNKVTLKNGEKIELNTILSNPIIYAVQEDNYLISHSTDGENFTNYANNDSIYLSEKTVANINFTPTENGTLTIRRTYPYVPDTGINTANCEALAFVLILMTLFTIFLVIRNGKK